MDDSAPHLLGIPLGTRDKRYYSDPLTRHLLVKFQKQPQENSILSDCRDILVILVVLYVSERLVLCCNL